MSILKGILHHWNKTNSAYDTIHPETESAQITDWHSGIMSSLASKTLGTVVDAITTDSVLGKLIKMLLNASGVKYLIDTNGYICFGSFFGGLIIQWGYSLHGYVAFPIQFTSFRRITLSHAGTHFMIAKASNDSGISGFTLSVKDTTNGAVDLDSNYDANYIAIGK